LHIAGGTLETRIQRLPVDKHVARDHTHGSSLSENIEQCSFASSTHAHQRRERARLDVSSYMVEQASFLSLDLNIIRHVTPSEDVLLRLNSSDVSIVSTLFCICSPRGLFVSPRLLAVLLQMGRNVAALEYQHLGRVGRGGVEFDCHEVNHHKEDEECNQDSKVAPAYKVSVSHT
jgi:hypothetical protein